jgi:predicted metal-binding membrane protein
MALIGVFTLIEKQTTGRLPTGLAGAILLVWAAALLVVSL